MPHIRDEFRRAQAAVGALFLLLGFQYATWASRLPAIKARLALTDGELGVLLMTCGIGAAASFPLVAALIKRYGSARVCAGSAALLAFVPLALGVAPGFPVALLIMCVDGVGIACLDVAMNAQGAQVEERFARKTMGKLHATFSGGALLGALLASAASAATRNLEAHFAIAAAVTLLIVAYARRDLLTDPKPAPAPTSATAKAPAKRRRRIHLKITMPARVTLWAGAAMAFATIVEGAMNDWTALYLGSVAKAAVGLTPLGIAVFSIAMVVARICSDSWRKRWGDARVVVLGALLACVSLTAAVLLHAVVPALVGFALVGLGIASVAPCVYVAAAGSGTDALALVSAMGTVGLLIGPGAIGLIAGAAGLAWAMGGVALAAAVVAICSSRITWRDAPGHAEAGAGDEPAVGANPVVA
ncbi:MFS transporter [Streptosporangiaceae bacterium NEAU-GS5]|nr:MFS transporter [Streptosporangiaceae bacterium NEAU-GS5]